MKSMYLWVILSCILCLFANIPMKCEASGAVTPRPVMTHQGEGVFVLAEGTPLIVDAPEADRVRLMKYAAEYMPFGESDTRLEHPYIRMSVCEGISGIESPEGYRLTVRPDSITIVSPSGAGLFYGFQTLTQLVDEQGMVKSTEILDYPRMEYRGLMLDISRHFRNKEFVKKQIDAIARLKMNRLHLHLTDAAGWRIEIDRYPELTDYAAWRPQETWKEWCAGGNRYIAKSDPMAHGGYLSREDAEEIVQYAADRYITVIPEIEMPSHSEEVTATFPELGCAPGVQPDLCIGNEKTLEFLKNVLDEVIEIFPSEYIHIGGDEAPGTAWTTCPKCQSLMEKNGLKSNDELQGYLIREIEKHLNSKGRKIIGWDEILEGKPSSDATIMLWRGLDIGTTAAESGYNVILTPGAYCYLDSYQDAPPTQPEAISGYTPLSKVYSYNPVPADLPEGMERFFTGIQGNLWCEYIPTAQHAEFMLYPRTIAIAEIGWTPQELRDWDDFYPRAMSVNDRLHRDGYYVFDLRGEVGNRREALTDIDHLAKGKKVTYNVPWWSKYNASYGETLTDGRRGGWSYGDGRWQGFMTDDDDRVDVTIDLEKVMDIGYVGGDFMQIIGPDVWYPENVAISVSTDGVNYKEIANIYEEQKPTVGLSFKTFSWEGNASARYVRFKATAPKGCVFLDEIVVK